MRFVVDAVDVIYQMYLNGWDERNGGNFSYLLTEQEASLFDGKQPERVIDIGFDASYLAGRFVLVSATGQFFRKIFRQTFQIVPDRFRGDAERPRRTRRRGPRPSRGRARPCGCGCRCAGYARGRPRTTGRAGKCPRPNTSGCSAVRGCARSRGRYSPARTAGRRPPRHKSSCSRTGGRRPFRRSDTPPRRGRPPQIPA